MDWNEYFFRHVYLAAQKSKDPSTQIGAILVGKNNDILSIGYNGFARGIKDTEERLNDRNIKYDLIIHGEMNCLLDCARRGVSTLDSILYTIATPCSNCCKSIIQAGIKKIVLHQEYEDLFIKNSLRIGHDSWEKKCYNSNLMLKEAGIQIERYSNFFNISLKLNEKSVNI